jgi:hypothetical protein
LPVASWNARSGAAATSAVRQLAADSVRSGIWIQIAGRRRFKGQGEIGIGGANPAGSRKGTLAKVKLREQHALCNLASDDILTP